MRKCVLWATLAAIFFVGGCKVSSGLEVPAQIGQGLSRADSLWALWKWLEGRRGYAADSLRLQVLFQLIDAMRASHPDSASLLAQRLTFLAQRSAYRAAKGLSELGWMLVYLNRAAYDSALFRGRRALLLLRESGSQRLQAQALYLLGVGHYSKGDRDSALSYFRSACAVSDTIGDVAGQADAYNKIGVLYAEQGQYSQALEYFQKALAIREAIGDKPGLASSYNNVGLIYKAQGQYAEALEYYQKSLDIGQTLGDKAGQALTYNNIGLIYQGQGRYVEALEYYQKALAIQEAIGDKLGLATLYNNIGNIYHAQGRYTEALEYQQKALDLRQAIGDKRKLAASFLNIGNIYQAQGRYTEALEYYQKALALGQAIGDIAGLASTYNNIGLIYEVQGQYTEALRYYQKSLQIKESNADKRGLTFSYVGIGNIYIQQGQLLLGRSYLQKALTIAHQLNAYDRLQEIYLLLTRADSAIAESGQPTYWKTAYQNARLYAAYTDSVSNEETIRRQAQMENQYENDKKVALMKAEQEKERALAQAEVRQRESERNLSLLAASIAIAGVGVLSFFLRIIRRQKKALETANTNLERANSELKITNQALEESNRIIQAQAEALAEKNEEILDSIRYAEQIQRAILPSDEKWRRLLPDSFRVYLPRDIVAGDFYWLDETEQYIFLGVADATGHGVPGAFVSLVCANALNRAVREEALDSPAAILTRVKALVSGLLMQEGGNLRDGMDIALIRFEKVSPWKITYAGANRPLWILSHQRELIELTATRQPVGYTEEEKPFNEIALDLGPYKPVMVYGFTDGIIDQMGGPKGRKLLPKGLKEVLLKIVDWPCAQQETQITAFLAEWRGEKRQMDDVTLIGVRIS